MGSLGTALLNSTVDYLLALLQFPGRISRFWRQTDPTTATGVVWTKVTHCLALEEAESTG